MAVMKSKEERGYGISRGCDRPLLRSRPLTEPNPTTCLATRTSIRSSTQRAQSGIRPTGHRGSGHRGSINALSNNVVRHWVGPFAGRAATYSALTITPSLGQRAYSSTPATSTIEYRASELRVRRASRVLVIDPSGRVLMFEYRHSKKGDALSDKGSYFTIPGGKADRDESFESCARRELMEETGISDYIPQLILAVRQAPLMTSTGEVVLVHEQYFAVFVDADRAFDTSKWTASEKQNIQRVFWASPEDIAKLEGKNLWPSTLREILVAARNQDKYVLPLGYKSTGEQIGNVIVKVEY